MKDKTTKTLKFICKKCGQHVVEQVIIGCNAITKVEEVTDTVDYDKNPEIRFVDGVLLYYQCRNCGWVIPDVKTDEALIEWLTKTQIVEKTKVSFRVSDGEVVAVFPEDKTYEGKMSCYAHVGQHSYCTHGWYLTKTKPASPDQYEGLKKELEQIGYVLQIRKRM